MGALPGQQTVATYFRHLFALCVKIFHTKRRHPFETVLEIFVVPLFFILIFTLIKQSFTTTQIPQGWAVEAGTKQMSPYGSPDMASQGGFPLSENPAEINFQNRLTNSDYSRMPFCQSWFEWTTPNPNRQDSSCPPILQRDSVVVGMAADNAADKSKVEAFVSFVSNNWCSTFSDFVKVYDDASTMQSYMESSHYRTDGREGLAVAIVFHTILDVGQVGEWDYVLRFNATHNSEDGCNSLYYDMYASDGQSEYRDPYVDKLEPTWIDVWHDQRFWDSGLYKFQLLIDRYIIHSHSQQIAQNHDFTRTFADCTKNATPRADGFSPDWDNNCERYYAPQSVYTAPLPIRGYEVQDFYEQVAPFYPLLYCMCFMWTLFSLIVSMTREKEKRIKESMAIMGVMPSAYTSSWFVFFGAYYAIGGALTAIVGVHGMGGQYSGIYSHCDGFLVWVCFFLFGINCISWAYMISALFSRPYISGVVGMVVFFMAGFGRSGLDTASQSALTGCLVLPQIAFFTGLEMLFKYEKAGIGVTFENMGDSYPLSTKPNSPMHSFQTSITWLFVDPFILVAVGWYLHKVVPRQWGVAEPFYFLFTKAYWLPEGPAPTERRRSRSHSLGKAHAEAMNDMIEQPSQAVAALEGQNRCVKLSNVTKAFKTPDGVKMAVDGVDMTMYENQIYALLGHNGAGKTTLISIISGMLSMTSGAARILGLDVNTQMTEIRKQIGVCPQHNILFPFLTVKETLTFYGTTKGISSSQLAPEVKQIIADVGLVEKTNVLSKNLSGGMKRKLHVAIALLGDTKVVFLDEPTSGMDPFSRRFTWDLLRRKREGRIMVLTTHFMDEADQLGDRVCIMGQGQVMCCGSSIFLKNRFGQGYNLTMTKTEDCDTTKLTNFIQSSINGSRVIADVGAEIGFQLPTDQLPQFPAVLSSLENTEEWGVRGYGVSITTMEEIFLKVARGDVLQNEMKKRKSMIDVQDNSKDMDTMVHDSAAMQSSPIGQAFAVFQKRFRYGRRDSGAVACSALTPALLVFIGLAIIKWGSVLSSGPEYKLNFDQFKQTNMQVPYASADVGDDGSALMAHMATGATASRLPIDLADADGELWGRHYINGTVCLDETCQQGFFPYGLGSISPVWDQRGGCCVNGQSVDDNPTMNASAEQLIAFGSATARGWSRDAYWVAPLITVASPQDSRYEYVAFHNVSASHAGPIAINTVDSALAGLLRGGSSIKAAVHPFPITQSQANLNSSFSAFWLVVFITFAVAFLPASMAEFVVRERDTVQNSKHLQMLSGCGIVPYWLGTLVWDFLQCAPFAIFTIVMIYAFDIKNLYQHGAIGVVVALLILYALACPAFVYTFTYGFKGPGTAQFVIVIFFLGVGFVLTIVSFIMGLIEAQRCIDESWFKAGGLSCNDFRTMQTSVDTSSGTTCVDLTSLLSISALQPLLTNLGVDMAAIAANPTCVDLALLPSAFASALSSLRGKREFCMEAASGLALPTVNGQPAGNQINQECALSCHRCTKPTLNKKLKHVWRFFPPFCVGDAVFTVIMQQISYTFNAIEGVSTPSQFREHIWKYDQCGGDVIMLAVSAFLWFIITCLIDTVASVPAVRAHLLPKIFPFLKPRVPVPPGTADEDVAAEEVAMKGRPDDAVRILDLRKSYGRKDAVRSLSFGIPKGGCFGLLGINGAGKTSTLKCMTGDVVPSHGTAILAGHDVVTEMLKVRKVVGYVPQFDGLHALMTVREHLELYSRLRGVPRVQRENIIKSKMKQLDLLEFEHRLAGTLSGGNKRKLSVAIAIVSNPPILFLDEPSSGMDPVARRFMWDVIADLSTRSRESTVILTTHAMEECEALCNNVGIMVGGQFKCLGSIQHLKGRFGKGFTVEVRLSETPQDGSDVDADAEPGTPTTTTEEAGVEMAASVNKVDSAAVIGLFHANFPGFTVVEQNPDNVVVQIPQENQSVASIFQIMETNKAALGIQEYSVQQTTLEQIFNAFAATQNEETAPAPGLGDAPKVETPFFETEPAAVLGETQPSGVARVELE